MRYKISSWFLLTAGGFMMLIGAGLLLTPQPVAAHPSLAHPLVAQCGSQASSCKNCHEVQGQDPVNSDATGWHESHAFGDFCVMCHAGNEQATDKDAAHVGIVPPLSDIKSACQMCHTDDLEARAQVYAVVLGIDLNSGGSSSNQASPTDAPTTEPTASGAQPAPTSATVSQPAQASVIVPADNKLAVDDPNVVDYVQRYNEIVLGERPVNWGNIILIGLIGLVVVAGGGFVIFNEMRLRLVSAETRQIAGEYPAEVVDMLPAIAGLKSQSLKSLKNILNHPKKSDKALSAVETLVSDENTQE
ncbi:MAG: hypothetical protein ABI690_29255 [Chloroflexota bacterium]